MTTALQDHFHARRAHLERMSDHWQQRLAYGDPDVGWDGDRSLVLYIHRLTDTVEVWYEVLDQKPVLVFKMPLEDWDIKKACARLAKADARKRTAFDVIAEVDKHNEKVQAEIDYQKEQALESATEKMLWAVRKDDGHHIAPLHVARKPGSLAE